MFEATVKIICDNCEVEETIELEEALTDTDVQLCFIADPPVSVNQAL